MGWATSQTEAILISTTRSKSRRYLTNLLTGLRRHSEQTFLTTVEEYRNMTQAAANSAAGVMAADNMDGYGGRTVVTADVQRQNEAAAYKIIKTTAYTSEWSAWTDYY